MDNTFNDQLKKWLDTDPASRSAEEGALLLLRLSGNKIEYANIMRAPERHLDYITHRLARRLKFRLAAVTHEQVMQMLPEAEAAVADVIPQENSGEESVRQFRYGIRADHESLPEDVKQLYVRNGEIRESMRRCHAELRALQKKSACADSDRYAYVVELRKLHKKFRSNWEKYDSYKE